MSAPRTWLITGASSGIGFELANLVAKKGDRVIATSRSPKPDDASVLGFQTARLDQNESLDHIKDSVASIIDEYGNPDIIVNNAAYVQKGILEEASPENSLRQYQANVFGPLNVYRAVLPYLRKRGSGTLVTIGSMAAWFPISGCNLYHSSKAALRSLMLGLGEEVKSFGIRHVLVEPGFFRTALLTPGVNIEDAETQGRLPEYEKMNQEIDATFNAYDGKQVGDPAKGVEVLFEVVTSSGRAEGCDLPSWIPLGSDACEVITKAAEDALRQVKDWEPLVSQTDFPKE